ncbi:MAG: apolipoprotein N-acyltransferase [Gammaproteobacteria bacterium]
MSLTASPNRILRYGADGMAAIAGAVSVLAFSPFDVSPLAMVCPALLFALWTLSGARRAAWRGFLYGAAEFLCGIYWIYIAVSGLGPAPWWLGVLLYVLLALLCAVFPALLGYVTKRFVPQPCAWWLVLIPAGWVLLEWIRSFILTGFPWLALGYSQAANPLGGYGTVFGIYGVSFVCVLLAVLIVLTLRPVQVLWTRIAGIVGILVVFGIGAGLGHVPWTHVRGPDFSVALMQGDIATRQKWEDAGVRQSLDRYMALTRKHFSVPLIVWPEAAVPSWYTEVAPQLNRFGTEARTHGAAIVYGVLVYDWRNGNGYNAVAAMGAGVGLENTVYYKRHLVPFAEYFPVPEWVKQLLAKYALPHSSFTPGRLDQPPLAVGSWRIAVANCYEIAFGRLLRYQLPTANFIINVSDDGWFGHSIALAQQFQMAQMAARETGRYVLTATSSGVTGIIGSDGHVRARLPEHQIGVLTGKIQARVGATPYVRVGNWLIVCLCTALLILSFAWLFYRQRRRRDRP